MGAYKLLQDLTVATNSTSVVLNDFGTITKDDFVKVVVTINNSTASGRAINLTANSSVSSNYHRQVLFAANTTVGAARENSSTFSVVAASSTDLTMGYLKISENDRLNTFSNITESTSSSVVVAFNVTTSSGATFTSGITSLTFTASAANAIGTGSRIQIYKLAAEKVADITVTSNTTQVDISNLSIDKDSEYLLVSDVLPVGGGLLFLTPNDLTTTSGYHSQGIAGNGTTAAAFRLNSPTYMEFGSTDVRDVAHTHIKLSNIGAFTAQSYEMLRTGGSGIFLENFFVSSTSEAITSITKLNIVSSASNAIKAGSRFTLYKLYE